MKIKKFEGNVKEVSDELNTLEVSNDVQEGAKVEKDDKQSFEDFKALYDKAIEEKCLEDYGTLNDKLKEDTAKEMFLKTKTYIPDEKGKVVKSESKKQEGIFNKKEKNSVFSEQDIKNYRSVVGGQVYKLITTESAIRYAEIDDGNINKKGNILTFNVDIEGNAGYDCVGLCDNIKASLEGKFNEGILDIRVSPTDNGDLEISLLGDNVVDVQLVNEDKEKQDKKVLVANKKNLVLQITSYMNNDNLAIIAYTKSGEPYCDVTVNLGDNLADFEGYIDVEAIDCGIYEAMVKAGIILDEIGTKRSGFNAYMLVRFDIEVLREYDPNGVAGYIRDKNGIQNDTDLEENKKIEEDYGMEEINEEIKVQDEEVQGIIDEFEHTNNLYKWIIQDMLGEALGYSNDDGDKVSTVSLIDFLNGLMSQGCQGGMVSSLIYYSDTNEIFDKYGDEVWDFLQEMEESYGKEETMEMISRDCTAAEVLIGSDTVKCRVIWSIYEFVANELYDKVTSI